ncbi:MAG: DUF4129 domain-containing protein, partial [Caldilineaceae bacterium]|nr:DUF4129 domain-containing protein [Caldilineaceae bacterium]
GRDLGAEYLCQSLPAGARSWHPRRSSQPPDAYLSELRRAFPEHDDDLAVITNAYMRVHYGDQPVESEELAGLRAIYETLAATATPEQP